MLKGCVWGIGRVCGCGLGVGIGVGMRMNALSQMFLDVMEDSAKERDDMTTRMAKTTCSGLHAIYIYNFILTETPSIKSTPKSRLHRIPSLSG